jgi:hypothetical protein
VNPNTEKVPTGVSINREFVSLGVGVTQNKPFLDVVPPKVAITLAAKRSKSFDATYTWVVSYCGATAIAGAVELVSAATAGEIEKLVCPTGRATIRMNAVMTLKIFMELSLIY